MTASRQSFRELRLNLTAWTVRLIDQYPWFDEYDLAGMVEEKTGIPVVRLDFETIRSVYLRSKLRAWRPEPDDE